MSPTILLAVLIASLLVSAGIAIAIVRRGRSRALARLAEVPGAVQRTIAASSLGLTSLGKGQVRGTGTLVLTDVEVAFAQWRPDRLVRIPRADVLEVDTTRSHLGKTMNADLLRIRWTSREAGGEDTFVTFIRDLDPWLLALGGTRTPDAT
jgi:hypothetical protein